MGRSGMPLALIQSTPENEGFVMLTFLETLASSTVALMHCSPIFGPKHLMAVYLLIIILMACKGHVSRLAATSGGRGL